MKKLFQQPVCILFASFVVMAMPSLAKADFVVSVRSLQDVFIGNEPGQAFINALAANPVTVTVIDVEGIQPNVVSTFNANQLKAPIKVLTGNAQTIIVVFSCPGLRTARLDAVINLPNSTFEVAMPVDPYAACLPAPCLPAPCPPVRPCFFGFFRRH